MKRSDDEDRRLISQCAAGNPQASEAFVRKFSSLVYWAVQNTLVLRNTNFTGDDLDDIHNTVFLKLFENQCKRLRQYKGDKGCSLATWVRTIAVRLTLNHLRKKGVDSMEGRDQAIPLDDVPHLSEEGADPWKFLEASEKEHLVHKGIRSLPPRDRLFLKLHFEKGLSIPQVAETMSVSVQNAYTIKHRAVQKLKAYIERLTK